MFNITFQRISNKCINFALSGDLRACHLTRLEHLVHGSHSHGISVCFDLDKINSIDEGVLQFFTVGAGRHAELAALPDTIKKLLEHRNAAIRSHTNQDHN